MQLKTPPIYDVYEGEFPVNIAGMTNPKPLAVIARASWQGLGNRNRAIDTKCLEYVAQCKAAGIKCGLYHFLTPNGISEQATLFMQQWTAAGGADLAPIVDVEVDLPKYYTGTNTIGQAVWQGHIKTFLDLIEQGTGKRPMIYTSKNYWAFAMTKNSAGQLVPPPWTANYPLWVAQYPTNPDTATQPAAMPNGWTEWAIWQYNDAGRTNGYLANDLNVPSDWYAAELGQVTPPPDPDPGPGQPTLTHTITVYSDGSIKVDGNPYP
jgi:hypothetical protein